MNRRRGIKAKPARKSAGELQSGAGCQKNFTLCEGEEVFFLDIPFYRTSPFIEPAKKLVRWYSERWHRMMSGDKVKEYEKIKQVYNENPNGADLLFLCRSCYGGVVRFRKADGYMSTPCGIHAPISPREFSERVSIWHTRTLGTEFLQMSYEDAMTKTKTGDLVYCDPRYSHTKTILYGAQEFRLEKLFEVIAECKRRGV